MEQFTLLTEIKSEQDLDYLIWGGAFLGSGGGGPISAGRQIRDDIISHHAAIPVIQPSDLAQRPDLNGAVVAFMGSPEAGSHGIDLNTPSNAFSALAQVAPKQRLDFALLIELGAGNSLVPLSVAVRKGIPVVDADGAGRAVPKIQDTTYALQASPSPAALSNGARAGFPTIDNIIELRDLPLQDMANALENYALSILEIPAFGQMGGLATYLLNGPQVQACTVPHTVSLSWAIGQRIQTAMDQGTDPVQTVLPYLAGIGMRCFTFGEAVVTDVLRPGTQGDAASEMDLDIGRVRLQDSAGRQMEIQYENENLFATVDGAPWAMAPDLICYLSRQGSLSNVEIQTGQRVTVVGIPADPRMRQTPIVNSFLADMKSLGIYSGPYIPIERLHACND